MLFNSIEFMLFFPTVVLLYYLLPYNRRWVLLLLASYFFYGSWRFEYLGLILISTLVDYIVALKLSKTKKKRQRKMLLGVSLFVNLGLLFTFKYLGFFTESLNELANAIGWNYSVNTLNLLLPVGISFYTFQTLSYTIDVYRRQIKPEKHLGIFALYVSYFPQLVAGPIERPANLLPQLRSKIKFDSSVVRDGLLQMLWGFFKKIVIADRAALIVNNIYGDVGSYSGLSLIMATVFFAFQIYGDFSGYSDIAIGASKVMGVDLMRNFNRPYFSKSISEFWKRWHISLSTWFRDYVYITLGGNRTVKWRWYYNLFITFLVSGLWHGAAWTFVIWGALHGFYLIFSIVTEKWRNKTKKLIGVIPGGALDKIWQTTVTFTLVCIGWVFFRADSLGDAVYVLKNMTVGLSTQIENLGGLGSYAKIAATDVSNFAVLVFAIIVMLAAQFASRDYGRTFKKLVSLPVYIRWPLYYALIYMVLLLGEFGSAEFIYFQF